MALEQCTKDTRAVSTPGAPPRQTAGMVTGLVLAGGGTKGAFEAGAVRWLVEEAAVVPEIITAASAGAIIATVLAQARTHAELVDRCRELRDDLLAMTRSDRVFGRQPWLARLAGTPVGRAVDDVVVLGARPPVPGMPATGDQALEAAPRTRARTASARMAAVLRSLPALAAARRSLRTHSSSLMTLEPLADALRCGSDDGIRRVDPELVSRPGLRLRMAVVALGAGELRYVCEDGRIVGRDDRTVAEASGHDLVEGVLASASVPMIFPPRRIGADVYMDGGVLENIPVRPAAALGATRIFAVLAVPLTPPPDQRDFMQANALQLLLRATVDISFAERQRRDLATPLPAGTELAVIDPLIDIVSPFEVAPGLMRIDMDYGWMRAADLLSPAVEEGRRAAAHEATSAAIVGRVQCWHMEEQVWRDHRLGSGRLAALRAAKHAIRGAMEARAALGLPMPEGAAAWWSGPEFHDGPPPASVAETLLGVAAPDAGRRAGNVRTDAGTVK